MQTDKPNRTKFRGDGAKRAPIAKRVPATHPWRMDGHASIKRRLALAARNQDVRDEWL
jgi:hypothetical protein